MEDGSGIGESFPPTWYKHDIDFPYFAGKLEIVFNFLISAKAFRLCTLLHSFLSSVLFLFSGPGQFYQR